MSTITFFWPPQGLNLDVLGDKKITKITDGDSVKIEVGVRFLSIDTPESRASKSDEDFANLAQWLQEDLPADIPAELADYLRPKLQGGAVNLQRSQGDKATEALNKIVERDLKKFKTKKVFARMSNPPFDGYGRLLIYMAPFLNRDQLDETPERDRPTFNLSMIESGWAAPFLIYPSMPKSSDLKWLQEVAIQAFERGIGVWENDASMPGYEFRMCQKLHTYLEKWRNGRKEVSSRDRKWVTRFCADMSTREIFDPKEYFKVAPYNRLFIWPEDTFKAAAQLNLILPNSMDQDKEE